MVQFYFLSVFCNFIAGYYFIFVSKDDDIVSKSNDKNIFFNGQLLLIIGIIAFLTGIFKLITPFQSKVPFFGDLIPAAAGIISGFCLLLDYYNSVTTIPISLPEKIDNILIKSRRYVGIIVMASAVIHFLIPSIPLF